MPRAIFLVAGTSFLLAVPSSPTLKSAITLPIHTKRTMVGAQHVTGSPVIAQIAHADMITSRSPKFARKLASCAHPSFGAVTFGDVCVIVTRGSNTRATPITVRVTGALWYVTRGTPPRRIACAHFGGLVAGAMVTAVVRPSGAAWYFAHGAFVSLKFVTDARVVHTVPM